MEQIHIPTIDYVATGKKLRNLRTSKQIRVETLANALNVTAQAIYLYESGERRVSLEMILALAEFYGCSPADIWQLEKHN